MSDINFKSLIQLSQAFPTELACHQYLAAKRWRDGVIICPHCSNERAYIFSDGIRYKCTKCLLKFTAKTDSFMDSSNLPTIKWIFAFYLVLHKKGISSIQLSKDVDVTQKTAWFMLQRIRFSLGMDKKDIKLEGTIASDETFVGGKNKNRHHDKKVANCAGRAFIDKTPVLGLQQLEVKEIIERPHKVIPGKMVKEKVIIQPAVMKCVTVANTKSETIQPFIRNNVEQGSIIVSDEWWAYRGLNDAYHHEIVDHGRKQYMNERGYTSNAMECGWKHLKLSIQGIYHQVSRKHLNKYVQEFVFRQNWRTYSIQEQIEGLLDNMVCRLKYKDLIA